MRLAFASAVIAVLAAGSVRAEDCPTETPEDGLARRTLAKKWFSTGQTAADGGDDVMALKAYQCSLKFVPHGFTAYNLAQIAERIGDLEVAIAGYKQYLLLVPDAKDTQEVNARVAALRQRLAKAREPDIVVAPIPAAPVATPALPPASSAPVANEPRPNLASPEPTSDSLSARHPSSNGVHTAGWILYGGAGAALVGGLVTNLFARNKMDTCRSEFTTAHTKTPAAEAACNDAKPLAYTSYALFGVGAAAAVVGTVLVLRPRASDEVALQVLPQGGLTVAWNGTFR